MDSLYHLRHKLIEDYITRTTENVFLEVDDGRNNAHKKHGENSIESISATDPRWLSILIEEVGEAAHELTYDANTTMGDLMTGLRAELIDVITVATAWVSAIDVWMEPNGVD